jgi:hypothetical protein
MSEKNLKEKIESVSAKLKALGLFDEFVRLLREYSNLPFSTLEDMPSAILDIYAASDEGLQGGHMIKLVGGLQKDNVVKMGLYREMKAFDKKVQELVLEIHKNQEISNNRNGKIP